MSSPTTFTFPKTLTQILDNNASDFQYSGGQWNLNTSSQWYGGSSTSADFSSASNGQFGGFTLEFDGTSIAFVGTLPSSDHFQNATITIDTNEPYNITYVANSRPVYMQWYTSPLLPSGKHVITVSNIDGTALDYALISVGEDTNLEGKTVVVDDDDEGLQYSFAWARNTDSVNGGTAESGFALGNSTRRATTAGSTIEYSFNGTSIALYGIFSFSDFGTLTGNFTIDDQPPTIHTYNVNETTPEFKDNIGKVFNFPFFVQNNLDPDKEHRLLVTVTPIGSQIFIFDYLTYTPSFASLTALANGSQDTNGGGSGTSGNTGSDGSSNSGGNQDTNTTATQGPSHKAGFIAGIVVAGIVALGLLAFLIFWTYRRRRRRLDNNADSQEKVLQSDVLTAPQPTNTTITPFLSIPLPAPPTTTISPFHLNGPNESTENLDAQRREQLFTFGPRPTPIAPRSEKSNLGTTATSTLSPVRNEKTLASAVSLGSSSSSSSPSSSSSSSSSSRPLLQNQASLTLRPVQEHPTAGNISASRMTPNEYPSPSQSPAPPAYDTLSTRDRPSIYRSMDLGS